MGERESISQRNIEIILIAKWINGNLKIFQDERDPEKEDELELKRGLLYRDSAYDSDPEYRYELD